MTKLLFIHGAGGSSDKWRLVKSNLGAGVSHFIDLPGHGKNRDDVLSSIEAYADGLKESLSEDVIVVGHSMGGLVAIEMAARSKHVKGIALAASHYRLPVHPTFLQQLAEGSYPDKFFYAAYGKQADQRLMEKEKQEHDHTPVRLAYADFTCCNRYEGGKKTISNLEIPILAVYGKQDRMLPPDSKEKLAAVNPSVQTVTIDNAGHYVILEKPEAFIQAVLQFQRFCNDHADGKSFRLE